MLLCQACLPFHNSTTHLKDECPSFTSFQPPPAGNFHPKQQMMQCRQSVIHSVSPFARLLPVAHCPPPTPNHRTEPVNGQRGVQPCSSAPIICISFGRSQHSCFMRELPPQPGIVVLRHVRVGRSAALFQASSLNQQPSCEALAATLLTAA